MSLDEFKTIYWWEWAHRFLGRLIGVAFFVPFIVFWIAGYIPRALLPRLIFLFVLGGLQGALGWYMVKSGLVDARRCQPVPARRASRRRVVILGYTLWLVFGLGERAERARTRPAAASWVAGVGAGADLLQMLAGALVAGLDAGMGYNTWPLIDGAFVPNGLSAKPRPGYLNLFENPLTVQFDHRMLGYAVVVAALGQVIWLAVKRRAAGSDRQRVDAACCSRCCRPTIGVWTLLLAVPITLGLAHQAGAMVVFAAALYHVLASASRCRLRPDGSGRSERLIEIGDDVVGVFDADRQPHHIRPGAGLHALLVGQLAVRGRGRMDDQAARVADIGEMAEELDVVDQLHAGIDSRP